jgi:hypothetical protein
MKHRSRAGLLAFWIAATSVSCGLLPLPRAPAECRFHADTDLAFAGRTTLDRLGLGADRPDADVTGMVHVSAEPVPYSGPMPAGGGLPQDRRMYCAIYDDGSQVRESIPDDWSPPGS